MDSLGSYTFGGGATDFDYVYDESSGLVELLAVLVNQDGSIYFKIRSRIPFSGGNSFHHVAVTRAVVSTSIFLIETDKKKDMKNLWQYEIVYRYQIVYKLFTFTSVYFKHVTTQSWEFKPLKFQANTVKAIEVYNIVTNLCRIGLKMFGEFRNRGPIKRKNIHSVIGLPLHYSPFSMVLTPPVDLGNILKCQKPSPWVVSLSPLQLDY